jgi:hypothetical protein
MDKHDQDPNALPGGDVQDALTQWAAGDFAPAEENPPAGDTTVVPPLSYEELRERVDKLQTELHNRQASDKLATIARELKIPEEIIEHDLALFADQFAWKDDRLVLAADEKKSATVVLAELQKNRPHWKPKTVTAGNEPIGGANHGGWFTENPLSPRK